jgi:hypothetical protein
MSVCVLRESLVIAPVSLFGRGEGMRKIHKYVKRDAVEERS